MLELEELREAVDIVALIEHYTELHKVGYDYLGGCPLNDTMSDCLYVNPTNGKWFCFGCGQGGDAFDFYAMVEGVTRELAIEYYQAAAESAT